MAPQERTPSYVDQEEEPHQNTTTDNNNLSNISLGGSFVNKAFESDSTDNVANEKNTDSVANRINNNNEKKATDFDDLLPYVGEFGLYQRILFLLMIPFAFFVAFVYFSQIFMTLTPEQHWCWIPELANLTIEDR